MRKGYLEGKKVLIMGVANDKKHCMGLRNENERRRREYCYELPDPIRLNLL